MLVLDLDTGDFPAGELEALYQSLLRRKKYHRLKDGRFLPLEGSGYEKLAEMTHMLQLSAADLKKGTLKVPAFRGLYLDSVITGSNDLELTRDRQYRQMIRSFKSVAESDYTLPPHMETVLRPYQKTGFRWLKTLESCGFGGILADEMGLGKTVQVIAYLSSLDREQTRHPSLIVCPASLVLNWSEEIARFSPSLKAAVILGNAPERKKRIEEAGDQDVWITSYELLRQDIAQYQELTFYACILDEGQHIKNQSTLVSKAVKAVSCRQRFILTGTPIENRLSELWNLFDFLMPGYLFSHHGFMEKLEKPIIKSQNPEASAQLRKLVQPFLLRRMKKDVLKELPPKIEYIRRIEQGETERKTYLSAVHAAKSTLGDSGKLQILAALTQLRQICCDPALCFQNYQGETAKLEACLELCSAMTANGHQILLFSQFTSMLDILRKGLDSLGISSYTLQGSTPKEQRAKLVKAFNAGGASVFLISLKAGGTGLNLTAADVVIHYDPWWNLAAQNQATDRAHRIGQTRDVDVIKMITQGSIEEKVTELSKRKRAIFDRVVISGETSLSSLTEEDIRALFFS
jgi:SNF2 family DNA or RNA helicase